MKRVLFFLLSAALSAVGHAQTGIGHLQYALNDEALTATVTDLLSLPEDSIVRIPETVEQDGKTYAVVEIGDKAFMGSLRDEADNRIILRVRRFVVPKTVKRIGKLAFDLPGNCSLTGIDFAEGSQLEELGQQAFGTTSLYEIDLPEGLKTIGDKVFYKNTRVMRVGIPSTVERIGTSAFEEAGSLQTLTLPEGLTAIGQNAFQNTYALRSIVLPEGITTIPDHAFSNSGLESVQLPSTLNTLGRYSFSGTSKLHHIDLPEGLSRINGWAFYYSGLESLRLPASLKAIEAYSLTNKSILQYEVAEDSKTFTTIDGVLFSKDKRTIWAWPGGRNVRHYDLPEGTEQFAGRVFSNASFTSLGLPENDVVVISVPQRDDTEAYVSYNQPFTIYAKHPFYDFEAVGYGSATYIYLPTEWKQYLDDTPPFDVESHYVWDEEQNKMVPDEFLTNWLTTQSEFAQIIRNKKYNFRFEGDNENPPYLYNVVKTGLNQYGAVITSGVPKELPRHLTIDGEVIVPQNASITYPFEYYDYESRSYHFPVVGIAANAFANCDSLESVTLPNGLTFVEEAAFYGCKNLKQVSGTGNMVGSCNRQYVNHPGISAFAFADCPQLEGLSVSGMTPFNATDVVGCPNMKKVELSDSLLALRFKLPGYADSIPLYDKVDEVVYGNSMKISTVFYPVMKDDTLAVRSLLYYPAGLDAKEFVIPDNVANVGSCAFADSKIEKLTIPAGVSLGYAAFLRNHSLKEVVVTADTLAQLPRVCTEKATTMLDGSGYTMPAYGVPYLYSGHGGFGGYSTRGLHSSQGYVLSEMYPSFDREYTSENTVVYMKKRVIDELEALLAANYDFYNDGGYSLYEYFFKEIRVLEDSESAISTAGVTQSRPTDAWFTIDGRRLTGKPSASGLYIYKGRKVVVK